MKEYMNVIYEEYMNERRNIYEWTYLIYPKVDKYARRQTPKGVWCQHKVLICPSKAPWNYENTISLQRDLSLIIGARVYTNKIWDLRSQLGCSSRMGSTIPGVVDENTLSLESTEVRIPWDLLISGYRILKGFLKSPTELSLMADRFVREQSLLTRLSLYIQRERGRRLKGAALLLDL